MLLNCFAVKVHSYLDHSPIEEARKTKKKKMLNTDHVIDLTFGLKTKSELKVKNRMRMSLRNRLFYYQGINQNIPMVG